jgi:hypothetical protein
MKIKHCNLCGKEKPTTDFYPSEFTLDKLMYHCIECFKISYAVNKKEIENQAEKDRLNKPIRTKKEARFTDVEFPSVDAVTEIGKTNGYKLAHGFGLRNWKE